jgi:hypothetical protein
MARNFSGSKSPSRIRFVLVEAELGDGDISQITQAITNALRPPTNAAVKRLSVSGPMVNGSDTVESELVEESVEGVDALDVTPAAPKHPRQRKSPRAPDIVAIDMNADMSLAAFAAGKDASSQHKKYLICAAWLKEHRSIDTVSAGHIYTCFRSMEWSVNIPDFSQPLRDLKRRKFFTKNDADEYEINHIGLDFVKKLGGNGTK